MLKAVLLIACALPLAGCFTTAEERLQRLEAQDDASCRAQAQTGTQGTYDECRRRRLAYYQAAAIAQSGAQH